MQEKVGWGWAASQYIKNNWIKYRLTQEGFDGLWWGQGGKCAGCLEELAHPHWKELKTGLKPEVDHNHEDGKVRGLLCHSCNNFLGKIREDKARLLRLEAYLRRNEELP